MNNEILSRSIGLVLFIFLLILLFQIKKLDLITKTCLLLACFSLIMSTNLFPWSILQETKLSIIQFPWRMNGFSTLFIAAAFSFLLSNYERNSNNWVKKGLLILIFSISLCSLHYASIVNYWRENSTRPFPEGIIQETISNYYYLDYLPGKYLSKEQFVREKRLCLNGQIIESKNKLSTVAAQYDITAPKSGIVEVPIYKYKGYKILVDGQRVPVYAKTSPIINFKVNSGPHHIVVGYEYTKLAKLSALVSVAGVLILIILGIYDLLKKYRLKSRNSV
ncbi:hypothetical protein QUW13_11730 [Enterococcus hirae]|nr:hypothetical protein [Enterococcus hirae]